MSMQPAARLSLIVCAALAATALYLAGGSAGWVSFTLLAGGVALITIDRLRWVKAVPAQLTFIPILAAAGFSLFEWLNGGSNYFSAADACVHFILLCQVAVIFSDLSGPQIGMSLAGSVILLLVSVKHQPHPGHVPLLLLLLIAATAALIFRVALGKQAEFQAQTARTQRSGDAALVPADRRFAWRMTMVTLVLALLGATIGLAGFFFFPRVSLASTSNANHGEGGDHPENERRKPGVPPEGLPVKEGGAPGGGQILRGGFNTVANLNTFGQILDNPGTALRLTREKIDASKPLPGGMLYLRAQTSTRYDNGDWSNESLAEPSQLLTAEDSRWLKIDWEADRNQVLGVGVFEFLTVQVPFPDAKEPLYVPGAATQLDSRGLPGPVWRHGDGAIRVAGSAPRQYTFLCQVGAQPLQAGATNRLAHPFAEMSGLTLTPTPALLELAGRAAGGATTDQGKAFAIARFLRESGEYIYTLDLAEMPTVQDDDHLRPKYPDPILHFLFDRKRGHCLYFATAYVVLARLNRIPARLAIGYGVAAGADQSVIEVPNNAAHAWAEVHLADLGWITVDPTPAGANQTALQQRTPATANTPPAAGAEPQPGSATPENPGHAVTNPILNYSAQTQSHLYATLRGWLNAALLSVGGLSLRVWQLLAVLALATIAMLLRRRLTSDEFTETIDGVAVRAMRPRIAFYRRMLAIMKSRGHLRRPSQSATEFAEMIKQRRDAAAPTVQALTQLYLNLRFGLADEARRKELWAVHRTDVKKQLQQLEVLLVAEKAIAAAAREPAR